MSPKSRKTSGGPGPHTPGKLTTGGLRVRLVPDGMLEAPAALSTSSVVNPRLMPHASIPFRIMLNADDTLSGPASKRSP